MIALKILMAELIFYALFTSLYQIRSRPFGNELVEIKSSFSYCNIL